MVSTFRTRLMATSAAALLTLSTGIAQAQAIKADVQAAASVPVTFDVEESLEMLGTP